MKYQFKIVITDDEEGMRLGIKRALESEECRVFDQDVEVSFEIFTAATGEECLEIAEKESPHLYFLDYKLPGINGIETLSKLKQINTDNNYLVIMMTAYASLQTAVAATREGAYDFLAKPFTPKEVRVALKKSVRTLIYQLQAQRLREEKKQVRFEFISVLSHELKAPIGAVEGYLDLISEGYVTDKESTDRILSRCRTRLNGMRKLIFDLIDMTRIEAGTKKRNVSLINFYPALSEAVELVEAPRQKRNIKINITCDETLTFNCDRTEIDIVLNNLISNAVKYNKDNGTVSITVYKRETQLFIEVSDTGIGLTQKEADKLFGEFVRIKNSKTTSIEGSGLGLSTVKKIAELYKGSATVKSVPDEGTTFTVILNEGEHEGAGYEN
ncbi:MAG: response regulator [Deltaproteobacteria bacterium]|nr:response regulator [Deltaproteobacteria bacterium]